MPEKVTVSPSISIYARVWAIERVVARYPVSMPPERIVHELITVLPVSV
jgi:hypothetical protein